MIPSSSVQEPNSKKYVNLPVPKILADLNFGRNTRHTFGGALRMNAGAMGWEIFDLVEWVKFLMPNGEIKQISGDELEVGYRYCREAYDGIALRAKLKSRGTSPTFGNSQSD